MPHPDFDNRTAFHADALHLVDEQWAPRLTVVVKGTFDILRGGTLALCTPQRPLDWAGQRYAPEAERSSYRYEPEVAPGKVATDVVFVAHAHAPSVRTTRMDVGLRVGPLTRALRVWGDRVWVRTWRGSVLTSPLPFERMPLCYERAFGGVDVDAREPQRRAFEPRNPVGRGFHRRWSRSRERVLAPNLESIRDPVRSPYDRPAPVGIGFVSPDWEPRRALAGTYDATWREHRFPRLATDFDRRHYNAASPGLIAPGHLRGDEAVHTIGLSDEGHLRFTLPGVPRPTVRIGLAGRRDHRSEAALDTIIVDLDDRRLTMLWRTSVSVPGGPHDVRAVEVSCPASLALPRSDTTTWPTRAANQREGRGPSCPSA